MSKPLLAILDHLLIGASDLASGVAWVADHLCVTPVPGGRHPGFGTHNALSGLGGARYLEVIAPDPDRAGLAPPFAWLSSCPVPTLATWAARADDLLPIASALDAAGLGHSGITAGSRRRPDGSLLEWQTLFPAETEGGLVPFFIRWNDPAAHPALSLPHDLNLEALSFAHPEPERLAKIFSLIGVEASVEAGEAPRLLARIRTAGGGRDWVGTFSPR